MTEQNSNKWQGKTDGLPWMQRSLIYMTKGVGLYIVYMITAFVSFFYIFTHRVEYKAVKRFYKKAFKMNGLKAGLYAYINFYNMGCVVMDRFAAYGGRKFHIKNENEDEFLKMTEGEEGFIQFSSHVGNYEMAGYMTSFSRKRLNALVYGGETETVMRNRKRIFEANNINMIIVDSSMSHIYSINNALDRGEIVSIPADRIYGSQKSIKCHFMGGNAYLPMGPFAVAAQKNRTTFNVFVIKSGVTKYTIYLSKHTFTDSDKDMSVRDKAAMLASEYAAELEDIVKRYPTQWYNYFDFIQEE